jgi:hypothetical protein
MKKLICALRVIVPVAVAASLTVGGKAPAQTAAIPLNASTKLVLTNTRAIPVEYRGKAALRLAPLVGHERDTDQEMSALLPDTDFGDGTIDVDVVGGRRAGYATDNASAFKGFVGISFRIRGDTAERFYLRTENARLGDQLFRNRSAQYEADPAYPWPRLRQESAGVYESYVDLEPGAWTHVRIEVSGTKARLYVNGATQPCLVVNDLKNGAGRGKVALWTRISSDAYFADLRITAK